MTPCFISTFRHNIVMSLSVLPSRVAIVADWLTVFGGAESVLVSMRNIFPNAPLFTTVSLPHMEERFGNIRTTSLNRFPRFLRKRHPFLLPFFPKAIESINLQEFDLVLSSSSFVAKGVLTHPHQLHICYCHAPARYFWGDWQEYVEHFPLPRALKPFLPRLFTKYRQWDSLASNRPDVYFANSHFIAEGIQKYYGKSAEVLSPPVNIERFQQGQHETKENFYLGFGRMVPQKRFDLLISAFQKMPHRRLVLAGEGRSLSDLKKKARGAKNIEFLGRVADTDVPSLLGKARALLFPQLEDAGISSLEALSAGTPVIAYGKGGVLSTLKDGETGVFFPEQTPKSLIHAIDIFETKQAHFSREALLAHAEQFSCDTFEKKFKTLLEKEWKRFVVSC